MDNQTMLTKYRNDLNQLTAWRDQMVEEIKFMDLPQGVITALFKGEKSLKEDIAFYEKLVDESEEYLPFADEDFLEWEEMEHA